LKAGDLAPACDANGLISARFRPGFAPLLPSQQGFSSLFNKTPFRNNSTTIVISDVFLLKNKEGQGKQKRGSYE
jgi:hypothetical protein